MSIIDRVKTLAPGTPALVGYKPVDAAILRRIQRGERSISQYEPKWKEALAFFDNDQFVERSASNGTLQRVETRDGSVAKPRWRPRLTRNRYTVGIEANRAAFARRVPVPRCSAPSHNAEAINAAKLSEKALMSAYRKLRVKQLVLDTEVYTFNCGAGYAFPYWDPGVGKFVIDPETGEVLREGEIDFWVLAPWEVLWEPGCEFEKSRWYVVKKAQPVATVVARPGYIGPKDLKGDCTSTGEAGRDATAAELIHVYHYLERPSTAHQQGRWLQIAGGVAITAEQEYPCDEDIPVIHELADIRRPHRDRPMGRGEMALDAQRTYNRTLNQLIAWKNLVLNPQLMAPKGSIRTQRTEEPGAILEYRPIGGQAPQWMPVPEIPQSLFQTITQCLDDLNEILGVYELPKGLESGSAVVAINERDESRRATFAENLAVFYSGVFEHILFLIQKHYTEPRLLEVKGRFGTESIADFLGSQLMPGITVHVDPGSVLPRTREEQEAKLMTYADRGWIPPHQVMYALRAGDADAIIDEYELDQAKAHREIQQLLAMGRGEGPGVVFASPIDNHEVHQWVMRAWMKTEDFERQPDEVKQAAFLHDEQHGAELAMEAMKLAVEQQTTAQQNGAANATKPAQPGEAPQISHESNVRAAQGVPTRQ